MATYEQMYMIPVAQYEAMRKGGSEGIVGNVSDSNVHNIEVQAPRAGFLRAWGKKEACAAREKATEGEKERR